MDVAPRRRGRRRSRPPSPQPGSGGVALAVLLSAAFVITIGFGGPPDQDSSALPAGARPLPAGSRPLAAAPNCPGTTVAPADVVVGLRDVAVRFAVRSSRCEVTGWSLSWPAAGVQASDDVPLATVHAARLRDADAGRTRLSGTLGLADASSGRAGMHARVRHRVTWGSGPQLVAGRSGRRLRGTLRRAWWDGGRYVGLPGARVRVEFRAAGSASFAVIGGAVSHRGGRVTVPLPAATAARPGVWRLVFGGDATNGPATSTPTPR